MRLESRLESSSWTRVWALSRSSFRRWRIPTMGVGNGGVREEMTGLREGLKGF